VTQWQHKQKLQAGRQGWHQLHYLLWMCCTLHSPSDECLQKIVDDKIAVQSAWIHCCCCMECWLQFLHLSTFVAFHCIHVSAVINSWRHADIRMWWRVVGPRWCLGAACSLTMSPVSQITSSRFHWTTNGLCCVLSALSVCVFEWICITVTAWVAERTRWHV